MPTVLSSYLANIEHIRVFDDMVEQRCVDFPVEVVMTFLMQVLEESALSTMATDLGVNGLGGFALTTTIEEKRNMLANAIQRRKRIGTVGALRDAIIELGYSQPIIIEGASNLPWVYDGSYQYSGSIGYQGGNNGWATFVVILPEAELVSLTQAQIDELVAYINHYKNARSKLVGLGYFTTLPANYDGMFVYDGSVNFDGIPAQTVNFVYP
jgi:P2-related tail formation protein